MIIRRQKGFYFLTSLIALLVCINGCAQKTDRQNKSAGNITLGAYYFDGWTEGSHHITDKLKSQYSLREPIWGWVTSTQPIMDAQINTAADAGLSFFSFDWYFRDGSDKYPLNHALDLFLLSPVKSRLKFCLMVANHTPFFIGPDNWDDASKVWIKLFKQSQYLTVDGKPILIFFSVPSLLEEFGSASAVKKAFETLKQLARREGLPGVTMAACVYDNKTELQNAAACGFDVLTGYNYHDNGLTRGEEVTPIDNMRIGDLHVWNGITSKTSLPYIPAVTLNWDPRPWRPDTTMVPHFSGYSMSSVYNSVHSAVEWIDKNAQRTPKEKIAVMYAWNENGEGGWLTPSAALKDSLLLGVKKAIAK